SGDSNAIFVELIRANYGGSALVPIVDAAAVRDAVRAGIGGSVQTNVGGGLDTKRFRPQGIQATVRMLSDGRFRSESFGQTWFAGTTAVLQAGNVTLVVNTR